jgi:hypothetical protein
MIRTASLTLLSSLSRAVALPLIIAAVVAANGSAEAKPVFKKVVRGDCECWCKTSAGTYTYVDFNVTEKACFAKKQSKTCTDGQGNKGRWHGCGFTQGSDAASSGVADPGGAGEVLQLTPRVVPRDLPTIIQAQ